MEINGTAAAVATRELMISDGTTEKESMFSDEEVKDIIGFKIIGGRDYIEVTCGCTSKIYGDAVGTLRVYLNGNLEIKCDCTPGCDEDKLSPAEFEKHSGRETTRKWTRNVWVSANGKKVPLVRTELLKYYNRAKRAYRSRTGKVGHHDEFVRCTVCEKQRRFRLRNKEECRDYHDAARNVNWKCSDTPGARCINMNKFLLFVFDILLLVFQHVNIILLILFLLDPECNAVMSKNDLLEGCTMAVPAPKHAKVVLPVCVSDVRTAVSQIAIVRLALISQGTRRTSYLQTKIQKLLLTS
ncbi:hypothetical protein AgCh_007291 [Apium graveolens]